MVHFLRRSLLTQLLSVYLLFVSLVLAGGVVIYIVVEQRLTADVQAADQALAQEVALRTNLLLEGEKSALVKLGQKLLNPEDATAIEENLQTFQLSRSDVDQVFWLDPVGIMRTSWPHGQVGIGAEFSPPNVVQQALNSTGPVFEVGIATETGSRKAGVIIAEPVRTAAGQLTGIVAASFSLDELSLPLQTVVQAQEGLGRHLQISILDETGKLIATPEHERILQTVLSDLPGAGQALKGLTVSRTGPGPDGMDWLFSAVPVPGVQWATVVQRPSREALAVVSEFRLWLLLTVLLFAVGGLLFWLLLLGRVIRPLHLLAVRHKVLPAATPEDKPALPLAARLPARQDEVGNLARSLISLEQDGLRKLAELQTLLETSNAVVRSLEPRSVVRKIIAEVRRLVDVQAAAVLIPDEQGVLRVMVSDGHSPYYDNNLSLTPDRISSSAVLALRDGKPVQKLLSDGEASFSYSEGFRAVLAIPIISRHAGGVVLLVHRSEPQPFNQNEIELLLTFANYATLAWEHAVLYERSDERLREVAQENERLYRQAFEDKQKLEAIMDSMSDGLVLTGPDGLILYANGPASRITGLSGALLEHQPIAGLYAALGQATPDAENSRRLHWLEIAQEISETVVEIQPAQTQRRQAIHLRLFDVEDDSGKIIGRGLLLRDVTREREVDEFKTTLLGAVGHELRTPLAAIKGHVSSLLQPDVAWPLADQRHFLKTISAEADRLSILMNNLLDLTRQEAGLLLLNLVPVAVPELIANSLEGVRNLPPSLELDLPADLPPVYVDQARIEIVLQNLVANAIMYGDGKVTISARQKDLEAVIAVWNNGPRLEADELSHIFDRFYRAHSGQERRAGGTGLGLAICKAFVEAHHCQIWAESDTGGTTILFSLPLVPADLHPVEPGETTLAGSKLLE